MSSKKKCIAMLLAGGQGSRLSPLTKKVAKPAVQFGSRYRIIDFSLSNCVNSNIDTVGVLTQYQPLELNDYLGTGEPWGLNLRFGGLHVLPPYQAETGADWFKGTANAIYQNLAFIERYDPEHVLILSGDHIYKMDYSIMLDEHIANDADLTVAVIDVDISEASRFGIMNTDDKGRILEFEEKPAHPKSTTASMGVYIFKTSALKEYLIRDEADPESKNDFGKNIIPAMLADNRRVFAYLFAGYWRDVGTIGSYWQTNMDITGDNPEFVLNDPSWRIYYRHIHNRPTYFGTTGKVHRSICGASNSIYGTVEDSIVNDNVLIEEGAVVKDSIILSDCIIRKGAKIQYAILDAKVEIPAGCKIGGDKDKYEITVISNEDKLSAGQTVKAAAKK
ncbi:MAG: glucose-1-phosphate adenylyltransferase [Mogibacterium sp.]|nr:glucose-1-phosphate adenylyltransferase [Mogibacterium sp.]